MTMQKSLRLWPLGIIAVLFAASIVVPPLIELEIPGGGEIDPAVIERVRADTLLASEAAWERAEHGAGDQALVHSPHQQYRSLRREVLEAERAALLEAQAAGSYDSRILSRAQAMLDFEQARIEQIDNPSGS